MVAACSIAPARAHVGNVSYSDIVIEDGRMTWEVTVRIPDLWEVVELDADGDGRILRSEVEAARPDVHAYLDSRIEVLEGRRRLEPRMGPEGTPGGGTLTYPLTFDIGDPDDLVLRCRVFEDGDPKFQILARIRRGDEVEDFIFQDAVDTFAVSKRRRAWMAWRERATVGFQRGVDVLRDRPEHWLLPLALGLASVGWSPLLRAVLAFVLGTLLSTSLTAVGWLHLPLRVVAGASALTVVYTALENRTERSLDGRWTLSGLFGLVHGFVLGLVLRTFARGEGLVAHTVGFDLIVVVAAIAAVGLGRAGGATSERLAGSGWKRQLPSYAVALAGVVLFGIRVFRDGDIVVVWGG